MKAITYRGVGTVSREVAPDATERVVECRCSTCMNVFDGTIQSKDKLTGQWSPAVAPMLVMMGWSVEGEDDKARAYCSKRCRLIAELANPKPKKDEPVIRTVPGVQTIADKSYHKATNNRFAPAAPKR